MLVVGQKLWLVYTQRNRRDDGREVEVTKVGRKWADLSYGHNRLNIETLALDAGGYVSPGRCYLSEQEYREGLALSAALFRFKRDVSELRASADQITVENIRHVRNLLGMPE